jgi:hypothetical protein
MRLNSKRPISAAAIITLAAVWVFSVAVAGQSNEANQIAAPVDRPQLSDQVFKNIQVLKGIPVDQFMGTMGFFSASTGLNCTDCHTSESGGDWAKYADDNALKRQARRMVTMMNGINQANFGGRPVVTCFTCHRGNSKPMVMPSLDLLYSSPPPEEPGDLVTAAPGQTPADQIFDKYLTALGGAQRVNALTSLQLKGNYLGFDDADKTPVEVYATAQGQRTTIVHSLSGTTTTVITPTAGWHSAPPTDRPLQVMTLTGTDLEGFKLESQVFFPGRVKQWLTNVRVGYPTEIDGNEVSVVQGVMPGGGTATLCFDIKTGLLTRLIHFGDSPVGRIVQRVDYSDYRDVAGVKIPFKWTVTWLDGRSRFEMTDAQPNPRIDPARFTQPGPSAPAPAR